MRPVNGGVGPLQSGAMLLMVCVVAGCGASSVQSSTHANATQPTTVSPGQGGSEIAGTLTAVFVHPQASQCTSLMTAQFVSQFFSADAARSGTSLLRTCRDHQRERAQLP